MMQRQTQLQWRLGWLILLLGLLTSLAMAQQRPIRIQTYEDANANNMYDPGEVGLGPAAAMLAGPGGVGAINLSAAGNYVSGPLPYGSYTLSMPMNIGGSGLISGDNAGNINFNLNELTPIIYVGYYKKCVDIEIKRVVWLLGPNGTPNGQAQIQVTITNLAPYPIGWINPTISPGSIVAPAPPIQLGTPLAPGQTTTISFNVSGVQPNTEACLNFTFHSPDLVECCAGRICFKTPECDCYQVLEENIECLPNGNYAVTLTLQNISGFFVNQIWTVGQGPITVAPIIHNVSMPSGGTATINFTVSGAGVGGTMQYVRVLFYNGGVQCCVKNLCISLPLCITCDNREPICYAVRPTYSAVVDTPIGPRNYNGLDWAALNGKTVAAVTCYAAWTIDSPTVPGAMENLVFGFQNLEQYQCAPPPLGTNWLPTPLGYHNGLDGAMAPFVPLDARWTKEYMGNVNAITFDDQGNVYVAQTSGYNADYAPEIATFNSPGTPGRAHVASPNEVADRRLHGRIFKIANGTGKVTIFNEDTTSQWNGLPSASDPGIVSKPNQFPGTRPEIQLSGEGFPEVGDITFDYDHNQIFATCLDDGKLYRYNMAGQKQPGAFDPWAADTGPTHGNGFAPLDELIYAAKYHRGRVYFSRIRETFDQSGPQRQEVWSVEVSNSAPFNVIPSTLRFECDTPDLGPSSYGGFPGSASPWVTDITFTRERNSAGQWEGKMVLGERGFGGDWANWGNSAYEQMKAHADVTLSAPGKAAMTNTFPHRARVLKYACNPQTGFWALQLGQGGAQLYDIGGIVSGQNSAGGVDFDFDDRGCSGGNLGNRLWTMGDALAGSGANYAYGLQGLPLAGGGPPQSIIQDINGNIIGGGNSGGTSDKSTNFDVEIPCPGAGDVAGTVVLNRWEGPVAGRFVFGTLTSATGSEPVSAFLTSTGAFTFSTQKSNGTFTLRLKTSLFVDQVIPVTMVGGVASVGTVVMTPGDADCTNDVGPADLQIVLDAFGTAAGDAGFNADADLNGNGEVGPADLQIVLDYFGTTGP